MMKKRGYKFYSNYLSSHCTVVFYLTDNHWWFKAHAHNDKIMKAGTPLSFFIKQDKNKMK